MLAKTHPSVVRRTCGVGTPVAKAASWNTVAERTSSSPDWSNGTFTATSYCGEAASGQDWAVCT